MSSVQKSPRLSDDAALVLALADVSIRFAVSLDDEAEHWLRVMRLHGEVGHALQALGVPEAPRARDGAYPAGRGRPPSRRRGKRGSVELVARRALEEGRRRDTPLIQTADVLAAVLAVYGETFDRVLDEHDTSRGEVLETLATRSQAASGRRRQDASMPTQRAPSSPVRAPRRGGPRRSSGGRRRP